ncbi:MAG: nitrogenase molybdenum-iron cofactor biosynthesis protein, partial [Isosphaeraceae bacterium]
MTLDLSKHPCFDSKARHEFARVHLPVAPKCNIQCNYCDRQYDCCNESRPGVTSTVLSPKQALEYYKQVRQRVPDLAVVGIAGPGDPF